MKQLCFVMLTFFSPMVFAANLVYGCEQNDYVCYFLSIIDLQSLKYALILIFLGFLPILILLTGIDAILKISLSHAHFGETGNSLTDLLSSKHDQMKEDAFIENSWDFEDDEEEEEN